MPKFERIPEIVEAVQFKNLKSSPLIKNEYYGVTGYYPFRIRGTDLEIKKGDYIINFKDGRIKVMPQAEFERKYRRVE